MHSNICTDWKSSICTASFMNAESSRKRTAKALAWGHRYKKVRESIKAEEAPSDLPDDLKHLLQVPVPYFLQLFLTASLWCCPQPSTVHLLARCCLFSVGTMVAAHSDSGCAILFTASKRSDDTTLINTGWMLAGAILQYTADHIRGRVCPDRLCG